MTGGSPWISSAGIPKIPPEFDISSAFSDEERISFGNSRVKRAGNK